MFRQDTSGTTALWMSSTRSCDGSTAEVTLKDPADEVQTTRR